LQQAENGTAAIVVANRMEGIAFSIPH